MPKIYHTIPWKPYHEERLSRPKKKGHYWVCGSSTMTDVYVTESDKIVRCNGCGDKIQPHTKRIEIEVYAFSEKKFCIECVINLKPGRVRENVVQRQSTCRCCNRLMKKGEFRMQFNVDNISTNRVRGDGAWVSVCGDCAEKLKALLLTEGR